MPAAACPIWTTAKPAFIFPPKAHRGSNKRSTCLPPLPKHPHPNRPKQSRTTTRILPIRTPPIRLTCSCSTAHAPPITPAQLCWTTPPYRLTHNIIFGATTSPASHCCKNSGRRQNVACACACCWTTTTRTAWTPSCPPSTAIPTSKSACSTHFYTANGGLSAI